MKKSILLFRPVIFVLLFLSMLSFSWAEEYKFVRQMKLEKGESAQSSLISFRGAIQIDGTLNGSVLQVGGKLIVSGHVTADIIALGTEVQLMDNAVIDGDFLLIGGSLQRIGTVLIKGEYFFVKIGSKQIESTFLPLFWGANALSFLKFVKILLWLLLGIMVYTMLPSRLHTMKLMLQKDALVKFGFVGLLTVLSLLLAIAMLILLSLIIVGIPLLIVVLIAGTALLLVSRTLMMYSLGAYLTKFTRHTNPIFSVCFGAILLGLIRFLPLAGSLLLILIDLIGIGIVSSYLIALKKKR